MRIAVIGYGRWGPNHARVFNKIAELVAIADTDKLRREQARTDFPNVHVTGSCADAVRKADAVIVATPISTHYTLVRDCLEWGKHVLCEKPLCCEIDQAADLHRRAARHDLVLQTGYIYHHNARAEWVRQHWPTTVYAIHAMHINLGPVRADTDVVHDLAVHNIALQQRWLGRLPGVVSATGLSCLSNGHNDTATISMIYPGAVHSTTFASWMVPWKSREVIIVGDDATIVWDDANLSMPLCVYQGGARPRDYYDTEADFLHLSKWAGDRMLPGVPHQEPLLAEDKAFLDAIQKDGYVAERSRWMDVGVVATLKAITASINAYGEPTPIRGLKV